MPTSAKIPLLGQSPIWIEIWRDRSPRTNEVPNVYGDYRELLADDEVEAVGVATAPDVRKPMVIEALEAGKHVLVQKPHGRNAADVEEINAVAASTGKTLVYSYFMRHQAENKESRQMIAAGRDWARVPRARPLPLSRAGSQLRAAAGQKLAISVGF